MRIWTRFFLLAGLIALVACGPAPTPSEPLAKTITVKGDKFVDDQGREVLLNGINIVNKSKETGYIYQSGPELYQELASYGVNCIRLVIIWDGLEPEPGVYDETYLKEIDKRIAWAAENNIFVVLDMHQDLFSVKYSDGAPEWATLDEGKPHNTGAIWSDAYVLSEAVQTAFDNFWLNKPAPDGIGVQDHYAALWKHLAKRYSGNTTVIGYDLMNEPFPGSSGQMATMILLKAYGELHYSLTGEILSEEQLGMMWADQSSRMEALKILSNQENYGRVFSQLSELNEAFEKEHLQKMYQKVSNAIREEDKESILFLEHSYFGNTGVGSGIERVNLVDGTPDPLVAYAPHGYDLVTDTEAVALASDQRVAYIYGQINKKGTELGMPVWLGEWGAFYGNSTSAMKVAKDAVGLIEKHGFGNAYWSYGAETPELDFFNKVLVRAYPAYVNGHLISYKNDFDKGTYTMEWEQNPGSTKATTVFIPDLGKLKQTDLKDLKGTVTQPLPGSSSGWLIIPAQKKDGNYIISLNLG